MPTLRFQTKGKKELACIKVTDVLAAMSSCGVKVADADMFTTINTFFMELTADKLEALMSAPVSMKIMRTTVQPDAFLYVPCGYIIFERVLGSDSCFGLRTSLLTKSDAELLLSFVASYSTGKPDAALVRFWKDFLKLSLDPSKVDEIKDVVAAV